MARSPYLTTALLTTLVASLLATPAQAAPDAAPTAPVQGGEVTAPAAADDLSGPAVESGFSADVLPTVQVNGRVLDLVVSRGTAYAVGEFTSARAAGLPRGTGETPRAHVLAFDVASGDLVTEVVADTDGVVTGVAVTDDGSRVLIAGDFTTVNGQARRGFAVLDAATGAVTDVDARLDRGGRAVATHGDVAYVSGTFTYAQGTSRPGLVTVDLTTGLITPFTAQPEGGSVHGLAVSPDGRVLAAGGHFTSVSGTPARGVARLDARTGAVLPDGLSALISSGGPTSAVLDVDGDERGFYLAGFKWNVRGGLEGVVAADWDGNLRWLSDCHGDRVGVWSAGDEVLSVGHPYSCATVGAYPETSPRASHGIVATTNEAQLEVRATAQSDYTDFGGKPGSRVTGFLPEFALGASAGQSTWAVSGDDEFAVVGGDFPTVGGVAQEGLVRFAREGVGPDAVAPEDRAAIAVTPLGDGRDAVRVTPTWDRDDTVLTHTLASEGSVVDERTVRTAFWARPDYTVVVPAGRYYTLRTRDPHGNEVTRTVAGSQGARADAVGPYLERVLADGAARVWSPGLVSPSGDLRELTGPSGERLVSRGGARVDRGMLGPALRLDGGAASYAAEVRPSPEKHELSVEAWIRPEGRVGGRILGQGASADTTTPTNDRLLYIDDAGHVRFGTRPPRAVRTVTSPSPLTPDRWHHVVGTLTADGVHRLYVDGELVAERTLASGAVPADGFWRVGADDMTIWPRAKESRAMQGLVDSPAVYHRVLTPQEVADHHALGLRVSGLAPVAGTSGECAGPERTLTPVDGAAVTLRGATCGGDTLVGDWDGDGRDEIGLRTGSRFTLYDAAGNPGPSFVFGRPTDEVLVGDWDGDGRDGIGVRRGNAFHLRDVPGPGRADHTMMFGRPTDEVFVGDFDGDGKDSAGVRRGTVFYVLDSFAGGEADASMVFGRPGDDAVLGDWDGNGSETVALRRGMVTYVTNRFRGGKAELDFVYGRPTDEIVPGDFDGDGRDSLTMRRGTTYYVSDELRPGEADRAVEVGTVGARVVTNRTPGASTAPVTVTVGRWGSTDGGRAADGFAELDLR